MGKKLNWLWRLAMTGTSFFLFGVGSILMALFLFLPVHLVVRPRSKAERLCRKLVHYGFRLFIGFMYRTGVLKKELVHPAVLSQPGQLIVANHPTLIDVIFVGCYVPDAMCVVKKAAWTNPFLAAVMYATGYIANDDPGEMIENCVAHLIRGGTLVLFPEGTRTIPGEPMRFHRGAAAIAVAAGRNVTPVYLDVYPSTLTKGKAWYEIPSQRILYRMTAGDILDISAFKTLDISNRKRVRKVNEYFLTEFRNNCDVLYGGGDGKFSH